MTTVTSRKEIPDAPVYVLCDDQFLGDTLILPCHDWKEAQCVMRYAETRTDLRRIRCVSRKPKLNSHKTYTVHTAEDYGNWYTLYVTIERTSYSFRPQYPEGCEHRYPHTVWLYDKSGDPMWCTLNSIFKNAHAMGYRHVSIRWMPKPPDFL